MYYATCIILTAGLLLIGCRKPSCQSGAERSKKLGARPQFKDPLASGPLPMGIGPSPGRFSLSDAGSPPLRRLRYNHRLGQPS